jgi:YD repeat-containing protein
MYDGLGRPTQVTEPDGSHLTYSYGAAVGTVSQSCPGGGTYPNLAAYPSLSSDEAGKQRRYWTDAWGRVVEVDSRMRMATSTRPS